MRLSYPRFFSVVYNRFMIKIVNNIKMSEVYKRNLSRPSSDDRNFRFIFVDLEYTGLDHHNDRVMEVACMITDPNLTVISDGLELIVHQPEEVLNNMGEWCTNQHKISGLTEACLKSSLTVEQADDILLDYVKKYSPPGKCCMAGNSIYIDRWFIKQYLPKFDNHLHYRVIDVSTIKELAKRWNYDVYLACPPKKVAHRALDDIKDSIEELRYYREKFFKINV